MSKLALNFVSDPVYSLIKGTAQFLNNEEKNAKETFNSCWKRNLCTALISTIKLIIDGKNDEAKETLKTWLYSKVDDIDYMPLLGHIKGLIHLRHGKTDRGLDAIVSSSHTLVVIIFAWCCPLSGAMYSGLAGIIGGVLFDAVASLLNHFFGTGRSFGHIDRIKTLYDEQSSTGEVCDTIMALVMDCVVGYTVGTTPKRRLLFDKLRENDVEIPEEIAKYETKCKELNMKNVIVTKRKAIIMDTLKPGDHVAWKRGAGYSHHGLITDIKGNQIQITHFSPPPLEEIMTMGKGIVKTEWMEFKANDMDVLKYSDRLPSSASLEIASFFRMMQNKSSMPFYNLFENNCEHLISSCITGQHCSAQVEAIAKLKDSIVVASASPAHDKCSPSKKDEKMS